MKYLLIVVLISLFTSSSLAAGIKGFITSADGKALSYAAIYVKESGTGTISNENGYYEISLPEGHYNVVFQYLGYETRTIAIHVSGNDFVRTDIALTPSSRTLGEITVKPGKEDPSYTIMRKAIAKAGYHRNQLNGYQARVYIKGTGLLRDFPWWSRSTLKKEGIEKNTAIVSESVSEIKYTRPGQFNEKVISIRSNSGQQDASALPYIFGSFYEPLINGVVTPLSPAAFTYYRFELLEMFTDRNFLVHRIRVIPKIKGDNLFSGTICIVEDWLSIHNLDLNIKQNGIDLTIKSVYAPVEDLAWLPVSHQFIVDLELLGFDFRYTYFASVADYRITLNPDVHFDPESVRLIDEKTESELTKPKADTTDTKPAGKLLTENSVNRKEFRKILKEYEKEELKKQDDPSVVHNSTFVIDSSAYISDSAYWNRIRPIPLDSAEVEGYRRNDSIATAKQKDSTIIPQSKPGAFGFSDLILGDRYRLDSRNSLSIQTLESYFNAVEGFNMISGVTYSLKSRDTSKVVFTVTPVIRYGFSSETWYSQTRITRSGKRRNL